MARGALCIENGTDVLVAEQIIEAAADLHENYHVWYEEDGETIKLAKWFVPDDKAQVGDKWNKKTNQWTYASS